LKSSILHERLKDFQISQLSLYKHVPRVKKKTEANRKEMEISYWEAMVQELQQY
jgi:DNA-binding CsgD family transcriptional regulator